MRAAEDQLAQLAGTVELSAVCLPPSVRKEHERLEPAAAELGLEVTSRPEGHEDLVSLLMGEPEAIEAALERFERPPFLLLVGFRDQEGQTVADALVAGSSEWLVQTEPDGEAVVLAPAERVLSAAALPGEWRAAPGFGPPLPTDRETLAALWTAAENDRARLTEVAHRIESGARKLDEARRARERLTAEIARLREAERHELDRVRLAVLEERAWVAEQAMRVANSSSWKLGHRLVRLGRFLTFRRDRGTNLPAMIAERMEDAEIR